MSQTKTNTAHGTLTWIHKSSATFVAFGFFQIIAIVIVVLVVQVSFFFGAFQNPALCFGQLPHGVVLAGTHVIDATAAIECRKEGSEVCNMYITHSTHSTHSTRITHITHITHQHHPQ